METKFEAIGRIDTEWESPRKTRVLILGDEDGYHPLLHEILRKNGYDVLEVGSTEDFLNVTKRTVFDLLITDINQPGTNSLEVLRKVKTSYPALKVIVMSDGHDTELEESIMACGAEDFIKKPLHIDELLIELLLSVDETLENTGDLCRLSS